MKLFLLFLSVVLSVIFSVVPVFALGDLYTYRDRVNLKCVEYQQDEMICYDTFSDAFYLVFKDHKKNRFVIYRKLGYQEIPPQAFVNPPF